MSSHIRPKWWLLYLTFPLLIALFMLDSRLQLSVRQHQAVQIGILLLVYELVHLWLKTNETALLDYRQYRGTVTVTSLHPYELTKTNKEKRPMFRLPDSEIKGTLSDTFEMDYIDADFIPVDEAADLKKE